MVDVEALAKQIAHTIEQGGNAKAIFGEPVKLSTQTLVPVALVSTSLGLGGGHAKVMGGGGGGFQLRVVPIGFIHEKDGQVVFTSIDVPEEFRSLEPTPKPEGPNGGSIAERIASRFRDR